MRKKTITIIIFSMLGIVVFAQNHTIIYNDLSKALLHPGEVYILDLSNQGLENLPVEIAEFINLEELILSGNKLKILPENISKLQNLKKLDLSNMPQLNLMDALNKVSCLNNLKELNLQQTKEKPTRKIIETGFIRG